MKKYFNVNLSVVLVALLILTSKYSQSQVVNGSFETSASLCPGPTWLGSYGSVVPNWGGINISWPSATYNTGTIRQNASSCTMSGFCLSGISAYAGSDVINLALQHTSYAAPYDFDGSKAYSLFQSALVEGCYNVAIALAGYNCDAAQTENNQFEVVIKNSSSSAPEIVVGSFVQGPNAPWNLFTSTFNITSLQAGLYNEVELRHKQDPTMTQLHGILVDDLSITPCNAVSCDSDFGFSLSSNSGAGTLMGPTNCIGDIFINTYHLGSTYIYNWGDGSSGTMPVSHIYHPGTYLVCLTEITAAGDTCETCITVCITDPAPISVFHHRPAGTGGTVGLNQLSEPAYKLAVYPNPASDNAELVFTMDKKEEIRIQVIDAQGKVIYDIPGRSYEKGVQKISVPTNTLVSGIYTVVLTSENKLVSMKLSITK